MMLRRATSHGAPRRSRRLAPRIVPSARLDRLFDLGTGVLLHPWLRRQDEGRALAALEPVAAPLSVLVRRWAWPMLRQWGGSRGGGPGQFDRPRGVAVSSGADIVVCESGNLRVQVLHPDGTFVSQWGSHGAASGQLDHPWSVLVAAAVSSTDEVFVTDNIMVTTACKYFASMAASCAAGAASARRRGKFRIQPAWPCTATWPWCLVSDYYNHRIQCFGLDGAFVRMWGSQCKLRCGAGAVQWSRWPGGVMINGRRGRCLSATVATTACRCLT